MIPRMIKSIRLALFSVATLSAVALAEVPQLINYQGRVSVGAVNFHGTGQFRFALMNGGGSTTYWQNSPDSSPADGTPDSAVSLNVDKGLYSILLGDASITNMAALAPSAFDHSDVRLRVWFDDGVHGVQLLAPDQRFAAVGYALIAGDVPNGSITGSKIASGAITGDHISAGTITSSHLSPDAIPPGNVGPGSIGTTQLANGAVDFAKLAKPPQSGSFDASSLPLGETVPFSITFPQPYQTAPVVTASLAANFPATLKGLSVTVGKITALGFEGTVEKLPLDLGVVPFIIHPFGLDDALTISTAEISGRTAMAFQKKPTGELRYAMLQSETGTQFQSADPIIYDSSYPSLAEVGGRPAVSFNSQGTLGFSRALDTTGRSWPTEWQTVSTSGVYLETQLGIISGHPAIAYVGAGVGYVRAADAEGAQWNSPIIVDSSSNGLFPSMAEVDGYPAICYVNSNNFELRYIRATNAEGTQWGTPVTVSGVGSHFNPSLKVIDGRPAICFYNGAALKYVRAEDAAGATWPAALVVDSENGEYCSLEVIDGRPAIAYRDLLRQDLRYVSASNITGSAWETAITVDSGGNAGKNADFANVNGNATIVTAAIAPTQALKIYRPITNYRINWIALPR